MAQHVREAGLPNALGRCILAPDGRSPNARGTGRAARPKTRLTRYALLERYNSLAWGMITPNRSELFQAAVGTRGEPCAGGRHAQFHYH